MKRIIVFGTFDILHPGHESFFEQAKNLGGYLIVVVARDKFVKEAKGKTPINNELSRIEEVRDSKLANKVILGSRTHNFYQTIRTYKINTIALGYDQKPTIRELRKNLKQHQLSKINIIRLKPYKPRIYKSRLLIK